MKKLTVEAARLAGAIALPPSKSHSIRAIIFGAMADGVSHVANILPSPDIDAAITAVRQLGAVIDRQGDSLKIIGVAGKPTAPSAPIDAGNSGQVARFVGALAALSHGYTVITGDASLCQQRVVGPLFEGLRGLGAFALSTDNEGFAPFVVRGPIKPGKTTLSGEDSQPVSGLLMAAALLPGTTEIMVRNAGEKPWIALTLEWLQRLGVKCLNDNFSKYTVYGVDTYPPLTVNIPGDLSAAAFPLAAAIVTGSKLTITNADMGDTQGDKQLVTALQAMGADITIDAIGHALNVDGGALAGGEVDVNPFIDAVTILAVLGCYAKGETRIINAAVARTKECDRLHAITTELKKMGADIDEKPDGLIIRPSPLSGARVSSHQCHRMAMSLLVAGMGASGSTIVEGVECIAKSFPSFVDDMRAVGAMIR